MDRLPVNEAFSSFDPVNATTIKRRPSKATIAGSVVGSLFGTGLLGFGVFYLFRAWRNRRRKEALLQSMVVHEPFKLESPDLTTTMDSRITDLNGRTASSPRVGRVTRVDAKRLRAHNIPALRKGVPAPAMRYTSPSTMYTDSSITTLLTASPITLPPMARGESSSSADFWRSRPADAAEAWLREVVDMRREIAELREGGFAPAGDSHSATTAPPLYDA